MVYPESHGFMKNFGRSSTLCYSEYPFSTPPAIFFSWIYLYFDKSPSLKSFPIMSIWWFLLRILCLTKTKQKDKQSSAMLEKKTRAETEARLSVEKHLAELQAQKLEEAASAARSLTTRWAASNPPPPQPPHPPPRSLRFPWAASRKSGTLPTGRFDIAPVSEQHRYLLLSFWPDRQKNGELFSWWLMSETGWELLLDCWEGFSRAGTVLQICFQHFCWSLFAEEGSHWMVQRDI